MDKKAIFKKLKSTFLFFICLTIIIFLNSSIVLSSTIVRIDPISQSVTTDEDFDVNVYCIPDDPVKAFEFKMLFNASLIKANSVTQGDIFSGYSTFYNSGIINNSEGSIINIFGLIVGQGNVTDPGSLVTISCTAKSDIGSSPLSLYNVGITNETKYITIMINNGSILIEYPYLAHIFSLESPGNNSVNIPLSTSQLSISINDPEGDPFYWEITTSPNIGSNSGTNEYNGTKICNISSLSYSTIYTWYVKCKDLQSGNWTNKSYLFTTINDADLPPAGGGGGYIPPIPEDAVNNPPNKPLTPVGSKFIEKDVIYEYSSNSFDIDEDRVRYRFDWGDGSFSKWSNYILSNETVSMLHSYNLISIYEIKVIAQDEHGLNSSWSNPFRVIVSQANTSVEDPVAEISILNANSLRCNQTIVFDASNSQDLDGAIINYYWDFGDGENGTGINCTHVYESPGEYIVTLMVVDNNGNTNSYSMTINIADQSETTSLEESKTIFAPGLLTFFIIGAIILIISIIIVFRDKIEKMLIKFRINKILKHNGKLKNKFK